MKAPKSISLTDLEKAVMEAVKHASEVAPAAKEWRSSLVWRNWWIGIPRPDDLRKFLTHADEIKAAISFTEFLAKDARIAALAAGGKVEPAIFSHEGGTMVGVQIGGTAVEIKR